MRTTRSFTGGGGVPARGCTCPGTPLPLWTEFLTHATKNITSPNFVAGGNNSLI